VVPVVVDVCAEGSSPAEAATGYGSPVIDDPYRHSDLVALYDLDNPGGDDHAYSVGSPTRSMHG
jgi:hypothetical protein